MFRFFVDKQIDETFLLSENVLIHLKSVRIYNGDEFIAIYNGVFYIVEKQGEKALIKSKLSDDHEFSSEVILAASLINIKRFELLIQKAAELGATKLIPVITDNISVKVNYANIDKKLIRWNQIALNASEQSFRNVPMQVVKPSNFNEVVTMNAKHKYIAHEKVDNTEELITSYNPGSFFLVGPEGGFTDSEVELARVNSFEVVSLGKRILRAETASIFLLSRVND